MEIEVIGKLLAPVISAVVGGAFKLYSEGNAKLVSYVGHVAAFVLSDAERTHVFTHTVVVRNAGRKAATNVRIGHRRLPPNIRLYPSVSHSIEPSEDGSGEIVIPVLVSKEEVTISYLYYPPLTWDLVNSYTKCDEGLAKIMPVQLSFKPSKLLIGVVFVLMFIGSSFLVYWLVLLVAHLLAL